MKNPFSHFSIKKEEEWSKKRCPHCGALLFETGKKFKQGSIRVKCRLCKNMLEV